MTLTVSFSFSEPLRQEDLKDISWHKQCHLELIYVPLLYVPPYYPLLPYHRLPASSLPMLLSQSCLELKGKAKERKVSGVEEWGGGRTTRRCGEALVARIGANRAECKGKAIGRRGRW